MEKKTIYALLVLVFATGLAIAVMRGPEKGELKGPRPRPVNALKSAEITTLEITSEKQSKVVLEKEGDKWQMKSPSASLADQQNAKSLADGLERLKFGDEVSSNVSKHEDFGVVEGKAARLTVKGATGKLLADFYVGKPLSGYTMIRVVGSNSVWQANGIYPYMMSREAKEWRNHNVIEFSSSDGDKLTVESSGQKLALEKGAVAPGDEAKPPTWKIVESTGAGPKTSDALDQSQVTGALQALSTLRATDFADNKTLGDTGLDKPTLTVTASAKGKSHSLLVGNSQGEEVFIKAADSPTLYSLKRNAAERVLHPPIDYRDKTITKVKESDLSGIDIALGSEHISLDQSGGKWTSKSPLDESKAKALAGAFESLSGNGFVSGALAGPLKGSVTLRLKDGKRVVLRIGGASGDDYTVLKTGSADVLLVKKYLVDRFLKKPSELAPADKTAKK